MRRTAAGALLLACASLSLALDVGCRPDRGLALRVRGAPTPLEAGELHFVVRVDMSTLARADAMSLGVSTTGTQFMLIPDDPDQEVLTRFAGDAAFEISEALGAGCGAAELCAAGFTVHVEGVDTGATATISLVAPVPGSSSVPTDRLELEVDGAAPETAVSTPL